MSGMRHGRRVRRLVPVTVFDADICRVSAGGRDPFLRPALYECQGAERGERRVRAGGAPSHSVTLRPSSCRHVTAVYSPRHAPRRTSSPPAAATSRSLHTCRSGAYLPASSNKNGQAGRGGGARHGAIVRPLSLNALPLRRYSHSPVAPTCCTSWRLPTHSSEETHRRLSACGGVSGHLYTRPTIAGGNCRGTRVDSAQW